MKFARYLEDTQTPEWKRAYIDYRGLKKSIAAIRKSQEEYAAHFSDQQSPPLRLQPLRFSHIHDSVLPRNVLGLSNLPRESFDCPNVHQSQVNHDHYVSIQLPERVFDKFSWDPKIEVNSRRSTLYVTPAGEIEDSPAVLNNDALRQSVGIFPSVFPSRAFGAPLGRESTLPWLKAYRYLKYPDSLLYRSNSSSSCWTLSSRKSMHSTL
ncbi:hypothetical protein JOM56_000405 [Amanita muscaria]